MQFCWGKWGGVVHSSTTWAEEPVSLTFHWHGPREADSGHWKELQSVKAPCCATLLMPFWEWNKVFNMHKGNIINVPPGRQLLLSSPLSASPNSVCRDLLGFTMWSQGPLHFRTRNTYAKTTQEPSGGSRRCSQDAFDHLSEGEILSVLPPLHYVNMRFCPRFPLLTIPRPLQYSLGFLIIGMKRSDVGRILLFLQHKCLCISLTVMILPFLSFPFNKALWRPWKESCTPPLQHRLCKNLKDWDLCLNSPFPVKSGELSAILLLIKLMSVSVYACDMRT